MADANEVKVVCGVCSGAGWSTGQSLARKRACFSCAGTKALTADLAPGERSRIYREELEKVIAGLDFAAYCRLNLALEAAEVADDEDEMMQQVRPVLRAGLTSEGK